MGVGIFGVATIRLAAPGGYEMSERITEVSPRVQARIAGFLYLIVIVGGIFAELFVRGRLVVHGDAAATAHNIVTHELLFRSGFAVELFYCAFCNIPILLIFYNLFKVVNKNVALLMVFFDLVTTAIESFSLLFHFAPLVFLSGGHSMSAFTAEQLQAAAYISVQLFEHGFAISLVFFGFDCLVTAYLILRSSFLPRILGVLLAIEGLGYLINSFTALSRPCATSPYLLLLHGYRDRRSSAVPVAPCDGR